MEKFKLKHFNTCAFRIELLLLVILSFGGVGCEKNQPPQVLTPNGGKLSPENAVNLNKASLEELAKLPFIGEGKAKKIVEYRKKYGNFRRPEELILVDGISDAKFRQLRDLVKTE